MRSTGIDRRTLLAGLAALPVTILPVAARAADRLPVLFGCGRDDAGDAVFAIDDAGDVVWRKAIPGRGHGLSLTPAHDALFVSARRPGRWMMRIDLHSGDTVTWTTDDLDYGGHVVPLPDGRLALTAGDADGHGCIAVLDPQTGRRIARWETEGVDPHELLVVDGALVVANGGDPVEASSLIRMDLSTGAILAKTEAPASLSHLSLRHLAALPDGTVAVVCQDRGPADPALPLLALWRGGEIEWIDLGPVQGELRGYCGAVAAAGDRLCLTSPHGALALEYPGKATQRTPDICGVAPLAGGFALSGGRGDLILPDGRTRRHRIAWDNHLRSS